MTTPPSYGRTSRRSPRRTPIRGRELGSAARRGGLAHRHRPTLPARSVGATSRGRLRDRPRSLDASRRGVGRGARGRHWCAAQPCQRSRAVAAHSGASAGAPRNRPRRRRQAPTGHHRAPAPEPRPAHRCLAPRDPRDRSGADDPRCCGERRAPGSGLPRRCWTRPNASACATAISSRPHCAAMPASGAPASCAPPSVSASLEPPTPAVRSRSASGACVCTRGFLDHKST